MIGFGMVESGDVVRTYARDEMYGVWAFRNGLLAQKLWRVTVAPFGRAVMQAVSNDDYALVEVAATFAAVLHADEGIAVVSNSTDPNALTAEHATFVTSYPKYEIVFRNSPPVNAGLIASIIGNDAAYGPDVATKAGALAKALGEIYSPSVHPAQMAALIAAAAPWKTA